MRILASQIKVQKADTRKKQIEHIHQVIQKITQQVELHDVDLVALPELSTMEYSTKNFENIDLFSEELYGETFNLFSAFSKKNNVAVCYGMPRKEGNDTYISQIAIGKQGEYLTHYDKIHTAEYGDSSELKYFKRGDHLSIFEINGVKVGIIICYDIRFPELTRRLCKELKVDMILHPVAFAQDCSFHSWKQFVVSRALENQVYFLSLNQGGPHFGYSIFCPPWIDDKVQPTILDENEEFFIAEIDLNITNQVRQAIPFRKDALESYDKLKVRQSFKS